MKKFDSIFPAILGTAAELFLQVYTQQKNKS